MARVATRRRLSEEERRAQILAATIEVVAERGFEAASASSIAAHAGLSKGLIWHYFADKRDLMRQAVLETVRLIRDEVATSVEPGTPVPDAVRTYVRTVASAKRDHPAEFRAMERITTRLVEPDGTPSFTHEDYEELYRGQEELFRRGQDAGDFRDFDTRVMAVTYQAAIDGMHAYLDAHPDVDADTYATALADLLLAAMAKR